MTYAPLISPAPGSIIYEDEWIYVCLARYPLTKGHTIVGWKKKAPDLHNLTASEYEYLMEYVDIARDMLLRVCKVEKVYLLYMDEVKQVHWHLVPRYNEKGLNIFRHQPKENKNFRLVPALRTAFITKRRDRVIKPPDRHKR